MTERSHLGDDRGPVAVFVPFTWPKLVAACERRGVPVSRVDEQGDPRIIRTVKQLREQWRADQ